MRTTLATLVVLMIAVFPRGSSAQSAEVQVPTASPFLAVTQTPTETSLETGDSVRFNVTLTNTGSEAARSPRLEVTASGGLTFAENGATSITRTFLGDLMPGQTFAASYEVKAGKNVAIGVSDVIATATADNHGVVNDSSTVSVRQPQVLGESSDETLRALDQGQPTGQVLGATLPQTSDARRTVYILAGSVLLLVLGGAFIAVASQNGRKSS